MFSEQKTTCTQKGCARSVRLNHKWDHIKAQSEGWFFQKDGSSWCPEHTPDWVEEWRKRVRVQD